jgi:hypothetical protein
MVKLKPLVRAWEVGTSSGIVGQRRQGEQCKVNSAIPWELKSLVHQWHGMVDRTDDNTTAREEEISSGTSSSGSPGMVKWKAEQLEDTKEG